MPNFNNRKKKKTQMRQNTNKRQEWRGKIREKSKMKRQTTTFRGGMGRVEKKRTLNGLLLSPGKSHAHGADGGGVTNQ